MEIYIGSEHIISPLGTGAAVNFDRMLDHCSGIARFEDRGFRGTPVHLAAWPEEEHRPDRFTALLHSCIDHLLAHTPGLSLKNERTLVVISSTKGDLTAGLMNALAEPAVNLQRHYRLAHSPLVISNACISGVLAVITAARLIGAGLYDHVVITGIDLVSDFVLYGFQSLYAVSDAPCAPFDAGRNGVTLGEACAGVVVSKHKEAFSEPPVRYLAGSSANDANHISGPSRTGEGLYRAITKTMSLAEISRGSVDFISAHGTATLFNDEMESIAFQRAGIEHKPVNSFKGYYGHTLGAAGLVETAASIQCMRNDMLVKSAGYQAQGTSVALNVLQENLHVPVNTILKTASGFGGCNAAMLLSKA